MGTVRVETDKTISSGPDDGCYGCLGTSWGRDDYFIYCDKCGKWGIDMSFSPSLDSAVAPVSGCLLGFLFLGTFIFGCGLWALPLLIIGFTLFIKILMDDRYGVFKVISPTFSCRNCNSSWKGIYETASGGKYVYDHWKIPTGTRPKAFRSHEVRFDGSERDVKYYREQNPIYRDKKGEPYRH